MNIKAEPKSLADKYHQNIKKNKKEGGSSGGM